MGGAFFLEDGIETNNTFQYNLGVFVKPSSSLRNDDITVLRAPHARGRGMLALLVGACTSLPRGQISHVSTRGSTPRDLSAADPG